MASYLFGPAEITAGGTDIGKTLGGGTFSVATKDIEEVAIDGTVVFYKIPLYGSGVFRKVVVEDKVISDSLVRDSYCEVVVSADNYKFTFYSCQIYYPTALNFGVNEQQTFDLNFIFVPDGSGNLYSMEAL